MSSYKTLWRLSIVGLISLLLFACVSNQSPWRLSLQQSGLASEGTISKKYKTRVFLQDQNEKLDLVLLYSLQGSQLSFAGFNPLGMRLFDGKWDGEQLTYNINKLQRNIDFILIVQSVLRVEEYLACSRLQGTDLDKCRELALGTLSSSNLEKEEKVSEFELQSLNNTWKANYELAAGSYRIKLAPLP